MSDKSFKTIKCLCCGKKPIVHTLKGRTKGRPHRRNVYLTYVMCPNCGFGGKEFVFGHGLPKSSKECAKSAAVDKWNERQVIHLLRLWAAERKNEEEEKA